MLIDLKRLWEITLVICSKLPTSEEVGFRR